MQIKSKNICPMYREPCKELDCAWFIQLRGTHPQTGTEVDEWGCAVAWLPILLIENAKEVRQGAAAVESLRNEVTKPLPMMPDLTRLVYGGAHADRDRQG